MGNKDMKLTKEELNRLVLFAFGQLKNKYFSGERNGHPPGGSEATDFVHLAITKTLSGERRWNPSNCTFVTHLAGAIRSEISNASTSSENKATVREYGNDNDPQGHHDSKIVSFSDYKTPENIVSANQEIEEILTFLQRRDPLLRELADHALLEGLSGSIELSQAMGITVDEVNNRKKRLKRALLQFRNRKEGV